MIYPMAYEGLEISPNIIYTGSVATQQVLPAFEVELRYLEGPEILPDRFGLAPAAW